MSKFINFKLKNDVKSEENACFSDMHKGVISKHKYINVSVTPIDKLIIFFSK